MAGSTLFLSLGLTLILSQASVGEVPQPCHVNETWMSPCNSPCPLPRCPTDNLPPPPCHDIKPCYPGCQCKPGYLRNLNSANRQCILASECHRPLDCKGKHERYSDCLLAECVAQTCERVGYPVPCPGIVPPCDGGCICERGYVRDSNGVCIDMKTCHTNCTKDHEWYTDCYYGQCGPKSCEDLDKPLGCPFIEGPCPGGCICEQGYLRNSEGLCTKQENCPPQPCHVNQTWMSPCNTPCPYPRCSTDNLPPPPCHDLEPCYPGCQCKPGYLRDFNSANIQCILASECPSDSTSD